MADIFEHRAISAPRERAINRSWLKPLFERLAAGLGLVVLSPLLLVTALLIVRDSPGPILYRQQRNGQAGRVFSIYKFRTMSAQASSGPFQQAEAGDPRITGVGAFLRKLSIDELPQLINVVLGDMALVGPRPHPLALDEQFRELVPGYMERYQVRPGITGLAQINGHRGPTPTPEAMAERVALDLRYVETWSFGGDIVILGRTVFGMFGSTHGS